MGSVRLWALALAFTTMSASAWAQDIQTFHPAPATWNYLSVSGTATARHLEWVPSVYTSVSDAPLVLRNRDGSHVEDLVSDMQSVYLQTTFGLFDRFEAGADLPLHNVAGVEIDRRDAAGLSVGDFRLRGKARLRGPDDDQAEGVSVAMGLDITLPTGNEIAFVGEGQVTVAPSVVLEARGGRWSGAAQLSAHLRPDETRVEDSLTLGHALEYGLGASGEVSESLRIIAELMGRAPLSDVGDDSRSSPLETLLGLRYFFDDGPVFTVGTGVGLVSDYGAPNWRMVLGFAWYKRDRDSDGDGLMNHQDACPKRPEDRDGFEDDDGCPEQDNDRDGIPDPDDQCPLEGEDVDGYEDSNGCPDVDNDQDGVLDVNDRCPMRAENQNGWEDEDGCPDRVPDSDGDGLSDAKDQCPETPEDFDAFEDEDGCPDPDNDGDDITDAVDKCPNEREIINGVDDYDGCPDQGEVRVMLTREKIAILEKIYFETDKAVIQPRSFDLLDQVVLVIVRNSSLKRIRVEGHTDQRGADDYNLELSQARAEAVVEYLTNAGVERYRLEPRGFGKTKPIETNATELGRAKNRRVEFHIIDRSDP